MTSYNIIKLGHTHMQFYIVKLVGIIINLIKANKYQYDVSGEKVAGKLLYNTRA